MYFLNIVMVIKTGGIIRKIIRVKLKLRIQREIKLPNKEIICLIKTN